MRDFAKVVSICETFQRFQKRYDYRLHERMKLNFGTYAGWQTCLLRSRVNT